MTEEQIRADERHKWIKVALGVLLECKRRSQQEPAFENAWKVLTVFAKRMMDNDAPADSDFESLSRRLRDAGIKIGTDA